MKILNVSQIQAVDQYTIKYEPIASIDLMERAAQTFTSWFIDQYTDLRQPIYIFCGTGNNGGDGLVVARLLHFLSYDIKVFMCQISKEKSKDCKKNYKRLPQESIDLVKLKPSKDLPDLSPKGIIIDAIFGSGLNRPVEGYWAKLIAHLNDQPMTRLAIDMPSGLFADKLTQSTAFKADYTFSFELPKMAFLIPENQDYVGEWIVRSIGLHADGIEKASTNSYFVDSEIARSLLKKRPKYGHKGTFGHALMVAGSHGKMGAAILASTACLRSGVGLLSVHVPACGYEVMQISVPEAMVSVDEHQFNFSTPPQLGRYQAIAIGPGIDKKETSQKGLHYLLKNTSQPLVLDADALNILAENPSWWPLIPKGSILTPHPKEFDRMFGSTANHFDRIKLQSIKAQQLKSVIVLKGAHTCIATPGGVCYFNGTGNPGMGTAGSGDVLTGIITGLLAQGYSAADAAVLGVYLHGLAGDIAAKELQHESLIARDITHYLGRAFLQLSQ
jgi:hydroxyethylthiazole kinase-like uncharacterized protein yjeF